VTDEAAQTSGGQDQLRVSVVVSGFLVPAWIVLLLEALVDSNHTELVTVTVAAGGEAIGASLGRGLAGLAWIDEHLFARGAALLKPADLRSWSKRRGVPVSEDGLSARSGPARSSSGSAAQVADVVVDVSGQAPSRRAHDRPGQAVWWLAGVPTRTGWPGATLPGVVTSVTRGLPTLVFELLTFVRGQSEPVVRARGVCPTHGCSPLMTAAYLAASAQQLIVEELGKAQRCAAVPAPTTASPRKAQPGAQPGLVESLSSERPQSSEPSPAVAASCGASIGLGYLTRLAAWSVRRLGWVQQWYLLVGDDASQEPVVDPACLRSIMPPKGHFWADPHLTTDKDATHVFFEDFEYEDHKGRISVLTLDAAGRPGPVRRVLETESHLSHPFVFRHDDRLFMIPESVAAETVDLYECIDVPHMWVFRRSVLTGVRLVDASLVEWQGLWWMFAGLRHPHGLRGADVLVLYMAEDPVAGDWREHPASPLMADVTGSRPGGAPFVCGGRLYRPAQDGSHDYGWGIAINEVVSLTPTHYAERRVATIAFASGTGVCGTHTLNRSGGKVVMDAWRWVRRGPSTQGRIWPRAHRAE